MKLTKTKTWLLSAAMTIGVAGLTPSYVLAANKDREEWIKYEDVPRDVKRTLDKERGSHDIKRIDHVVRDGREFYRATIDTKGDDAVIRVDTSGRVMSRQEARDEAVTGERRDTSERRDISRDSRGDRDDSTVVKYASLPERVKETLDRERGNREVKTIYLTHNGDRTYYNAIVDERNGDRSVRINEGGKLLSEEDIREARTAGSRSNSSNRTSDIRRGVEDDGERIAFDRLPGDVKTALGREAGQDRVTNVYRYDRRGGSVYEAEVDGKVGTRVIRVNENGRVVSESDANAEGRRSVRFDDLPGQVKQSLGRDIPRGASRVVQITQDGRTYYRAQTDNGNWITVDDEGREVRDFSSSRGR